MKPGNQAPTNAANSPSTPAAKKENAPDSTPNQNANKTPTTPQPTDAADKEKKSDATPAPSGSGEYKNIIDIKEMLKRVNADRATKGLNPLCLSKTLMKTAMAQAVAMAKTNSLAHGDIKATMQEFKGGVKGENVGVYSSNSMDGIMELFFKSKDHHCNILGAYTHFGAAEVPKDPSNPTKGPFYWAQHFGLDKVKGEEECINGTEYTDSNGTGCPPAPQK